VFDESAVGATVNVIKKSQARIIYHDRVKAREYYEDNPDASYREVARQVDASQPIVTEWLKEDFDEGDTTPLAAFARNEDEHEKTQDVAQKATADDVDDDIQQEAQEQAERLSRGETTPNEAAGKVQQTERDHDDTSDISQFTSQETDEWSSPREIVEPLDTAVGGFDLDPCSGAENSPFANNTYTEAGDGLSKAWFGDVWVNPPYSEVSDWVGKATGSAADRVVFLCKGDSSTGWWQTAIAEAAVVCAVDHRLQFGDGQNSAPFPSHIFVFGPVSGDLAATLRQHGTLLTPGWSQ
jgi:phage N-6-adenine-methyltransferase